MKKAFTAALVLAVAMGVRAAEVYTIDAAHAEIGFSIKHMVINNVKGRFEEFSGDVAWDGKDVTGLKTKAVIKVASIDTGIKGRDEHLLGADFFEADKYPEITFVSKRVEKRGAQAVAIGDFTMHGVTREIELPFTVNGPIQDPMGKTRIGVEAAVTLNRQDYGISFSKTMDNGGLMIGNDVKIQIDLEAIR